MCFESNSSTNTSLFLQYDHFDAILIIIFCIFSWFRLCNCCFFCCLSSSSSIVWWSDTFVSFNSWIICSTVFHLNVPFICKYNYQQKYSFLIVFIWKEILKIVYKNLKPSETLSIKLSKFQNFLEKFVENSTETMLFVNTYVFVFPQLVQSKDKLRNKK